MEFAILGREDSARCQYTHKKTECFRVQIPTGSPAVLVSADALMQEIRKAGIRAAMSADTAIALSANEDELQPAPTQGGGRSATRSGAKSA